MANLVSSGSKITQSQMNTLVAQSNATYQRYFGTANHVSTPSSNSKILRSQCNSLLTDLNACINKTTYRRKTYYTGGAISDIASGSKMSAASINSIYNAAQNLYDDYCSCHTNCSCNCNYCTCDNCSCDNHCNCDCDDCSCDNHCSCDCDDCGCDCDDCGCDCNYCTCDDCCDDCCQCGIDSSGDCTAD